MRNARWNLSFALTGALFAGLSGCMTSKTHEAGTLPPSLETQMQNAVSRVKHTRGVDRLGSLRIITAFGRHATAPVTTELLTSEDPQLRSNAVYVLGEIYRLDGDPLAFEAVRSSMGDENRAVRLEAARALLDGGDLSGIGELVEGLERPDRSTRVHSFLALRRAAGGRSFGYDPDGDEASRIDGADRFRSYMAAVAD